jgi:hypothetical protein
MAEDRTRQTAAKLHTTGPNIPDRDIRLDLLGPAASGSGPSRRRSKESDADLTGRLPEVERVEGGSGYCEPNRDGPGSTKMCRYGNVALFMAMFHVVAGIPHRFAPSLYKGSPGLSLSVACERSPL